MDKAIENRLNVPIEKINEFCSRWQIVELDFFGSVLREDFSPDSDVDVLVVFSPNAHWTLLDHIHMEQDLSILLGRSVDLVSKRAIEKSPNWIRRQEILASAQPFYESR